MKYCEMKISRTPSEFPEQMCVKRLKSICYTRPPPGSGHSHMRLPAILGEGRKKGKAGGKPVDLKTHLARVTENGPEGLGHRII